MLVIRLQRVGKKNQPSFRIVLQEKSWAPQGKTQELLGFYDPVHKEKKFQKERVKYWLSKGAHPSPTVHNLLVDEGVLSGPKVKSWRPKKKSGGAVVESHGSTEPAAPREEKAGASTESEETIRQVEEAPAAVSAQGPAAGESKEPAKDPAEESDPEAALESAGREPEKEGRGEAEDDSSGEAAPSPEDPGGQAKGGA